MVTSESACAEGRNTFGKPDAGNPHVRFDEGGGTPRGVPPLLDCSTIFGRYRHLCELAEVPRDRGWTISVANEPVKLRSVPMTDAS